MDHVRLTSTSSQTRGSPIIVGEQYDLAEAVATSYSGKLHGGVSAKLAYDAALLPMSGYERSSKKSFDGEPHPIPFC